ncbi:MAG TPA: phosphatidylglycerophosphatase A [Ignavibacteriaceae bacterium]|nr:phosphatidylglycerophosphatase A [Ignavibacteriaceae bacterium]
MKLNFFDKLFGSGFYTGYISLAPGTFGSFLALLIYWIPGFEKAVVLIPAIILFTFYGIYLGNKFEKIYGKDPSQCTIDEFVGTWISLILVPKTILISGITFIVWRLFDIIKPFPVKHAEKLEGGAGIMLDDIVAGIYSMIIIHFILLIFKL